MLEIGDQIKSFLAENNDHGQQEELINNLAESLEGRFGKIFNAEQLSQYMFFAGQFHDKNLQFRIEFSTMVRWEHILLLLPILDFEEKLYYAQLTGKLDLSARELK